MQTVGTRIDWRQFASFADHQRTLGRFFNSDSQINDDGAVLSVSPNEWSAAHYDKRINEPWLRRAVVDSV
jgi:hypothetical protein